MAFVAGSSRNHMHYPLNDTFSSYALTSLKVVVFLVPRTRIGSKWFSTRSHNLSVWSSNHRERTDSRRGLNTNETRLKSPLEGEGGVSVYFLLSLYPTASLLVSLNNQGQAVGCRMDVELLCFMRAHLYSVGGP